MGLTGQAATVDELLDRPGEHPAHRPLRRPVRPRCAKAGDELLERFSLTDAADRIAKTYSGGMRRRLDLAVSLVATPPVLFLDEPTTGLDPRSRTELWEVLRGLVADGTTLLLTTQYLEEADQLADDIVVIDKGTVIAHGTPTQLKDQAGRASVVLTVTDAADLPRPSRCLRGCSDEVHVDPGARRITAKASGIADMLRIGEAVEEQRHRRRRPRPGPAQPRRRVPAPDRPPRRGESPTTSSPRPSSRRRPDDDAARPLPAPPVEIKPAVVRRGLPARRAPQPDPHQADARAAARRHDPAGDVRAALRVRLRQLDRRAGLATTASS